ncbi:MAG: Rrf2 family transcriptional regulator [Bacteroidota bacterium]|nr:Rrf2 family transcriptional regulator [Bacteroidota bacterium]MDX5431439.1 Rrf2 family transcriptional regulator [Bacteroidota bacterium]MDX5470167.1 Rrf2 family transcriptional regulator [Bacteroidota bacterium]
MLSKKNRYAFHALEYLALNQGKGPVLIEEIAKAKKIPRKFLENILLELKKAGILHSKMGKGGGYYLLKEPREIAFAQVIRLIDGPIALLPCVSINYHEKCTECVHEEAECPLRMVMIQVRDESLKVLENKTLADVIGTDF